MAKYTRKFVGGKKNKNSRKKSKKLNNNKCGYMSLNNSIGKKVPKVVFKARKKNGKVKGKNKFSWHNLSSDKVFNKRRVVVFALPGAFTPTCSTTHLPEYEQKYEEIKKQNIDEIYCLSVNDAFVLFKWCKDLKVDNVKMLPDGNGIFTKRMGALVNKRNLGFGKRSWRYSMVVDNGIIEKIFVEKGLRNNCKTDPFEVSDAETMLKYLKTVN